MNIKNILIALVVVAGIILGFMWLQNRPAEPKIDLSSDETLTAYSAEEIASHGIEDGCWIIVNNGVYDVTEYGVDGNHPGGKDSLIEYCGKESTDIFNGIHSKRAKLLLTDYLIGRVEVEETIEE